MHEGACETESQIPRALARGIWRTVRTSPIALWQQNPDRSVLITIITWHFKFRPVNVSNLHLKYEYRARSESRFACYSHRCVTWCPFNDGNCRLTIPVVKGRCARDVLSCHIFHIGVLKFVKTISTTIKHIYTESANIIEGCNVAFDTNDAGISNKPCQWLPLR